MKPVFTQFIILLFSVLFFSCENDPADIRKWLDLEEPSREIAREVEILYSDSAQVRVKVTAPTLINYLDKKEPRKEFPDGIDVVFYDKYEQVQSTLVADYALMLEQEDLIIARYNVLLEGREGRKLQTEELFWSEKEKKLYTEQFAVLSTGEEVIFGVGFEANEDFKKARIKLVKGRLDIEDNESKEGNEN